MTTFMQTRDLKIVISHARKYIVVIRSDVTKKNDKVTFVYYVLVVRAI